ncbi:MAG: helix-turn-helix domain-containing protein [Microcoleaceae cyanobacterium]
MDFHSSLSNPQPLATEVSSEHLDYLVTEIEDELHASPVYNLSLTNLQKLLGNAAVKGDIIVRAVGREAIQIALRQMTLAYSNVAPNSQQQTRLSAVPVSPTENVLPPSSESQTESAAPQLPVSEPAHIEQTTTVVSPQEDIAGEDSPHHIKSTPPTSIAKTETSETTDTPAKKKKKKLTATEIAAQKVQQRTDYLRQVGEQFQQARQTLGLSQCELHRSTMVPLSHLEALEMAIEDQLPEDVYLRGFICRLGNALGLDGTAMAAALPAPDALQSLTPSWSSPEPDEDFYLNPVHLYLGYAALLAGSIGGIALLSQQGTPENIPAPNVPDIPENTSQSQRFVEPELTPGLQSIDEDILLGTDIVRPEVIRSQSISDQSYPI